MKELEIIPLGSTKDVKGEKHVLFLPTLPTFQSTSPMTSFMRRESERVGVSVRAFVRSFLYHAHSMRARARARAVLSAKRY